MPTKKEFLQYVAVQNSGKYNMITEARMAASEAGLSLDTYLQIIRNYSRLSGMYLR
jgi:hypothetical protein